MKPLSLMLAMLILSLSAGYGKMLRGYVQEGGEAHPEQYECGCGCSDARTADNESDAGCASAAGDALVCAIGSRNGVEDGVGNECGASGKSRSESVHEDGLRSDNYASGNHSDESDASGCHCPFCITNPSCPGYAPVLQRYGGLMRLAEFDTNEIVFIQNKYIAPYLAGLLQPPRYV